MIDTLQANILKSHGRKHTLHVCLYFGANNTREYQELFRKWLADLGRHLITSYHQQLSDTQRFKRDPGFQSTVYTLAMSKEAYSKLGICEDFHPKDEFFKSSMSNYDTRRQLNDYDRQLNDIDNCDSSDTHDSNETLNELHAILTIAHDQKAALEIAWQKIKKTSPFEKTRGAKYKLEYGHRILGTDGRAKGPFGFTDGLTNPRDFLSVANAVLVKEPGKGDHYGSYMVFRKTYANQAYFKTICDKIVQEYNVSEEYAAAMIAGRFRNGTPLISHAKEKDASIWSAQNVDEHFDYTKDKKGHICPIAAHIRSVNPRDGKQRPLPIVRRSMSYENINTCEKGLLFISYQKDIKQQFMSLFEEGKADHFLYTPTNKNTRRRELSFPAKRGSSQKGSIIEIEQNLTEFRGGDFFFCPSLSFLKQIESVI